MDKIVWYNHTFSSINIKPAFYDIEVIGGTLYYAYYFMLYPTGLAIVLAVPNELASISYNPTTNYFQEYWKIFYDNEYLLAQIKENWFDSSKKIFSTYKNLDEESRKILNETVVDAIQEISDKLK